MKCAGTASGAISVQVVRKSPGATEALEHAGSARTDAELVTGSGPAREANVQEQSTVTPHSSESNNCGCHCNLTEFDCIQPAKG